MTEEELKAWFNQPSDDLFSDGGITGDLVSPELLKKIADSPIPIPEFQPTKRKK